MGPNIDYESVILKCHLVGAVLMPRTFLFFVPEKLHDLADS